MKTLRKSLLIILGAVFALAVAVFAAACKDNKSGNSVEYTVEVYLESSDGYALSEQYSTKKSGTVDAEVTVTPPTVPNYYFKADHESNVLKLTLSNNKSENIFKLYYNKSVTAKITYNANAPAGYNARGNVADSVVNPDGSVVIAESGYKIEGYRFAGWATSPDGKVEYLAGQETTVGTSLNLYAVWDLGLADRYGGADVIYVSSAEEGVVILERGGVEFKGELDGNDFTFKLPNGNDLIGKLYLNIDCFSYYHEGIEGTYYYQNSYYNFADSNGQFDVDYSDYITIDGYGNATRYYVNESKVPTEDAGFVMYSSVTNEFLFLVTEGANAGAYVLFTTKRIAGDVLIFSSTNGEAGEYQQFYSADGGSFYGGEIGLILDGYGNITYYDIFNGVYCLDDMYSNDINGDGYADYFIYKVHARLKDINNQARDVLGLKVVDGWFEISFYTIPLNDYINAFVEPNGEVGSYNAKEGEGTLVLDGYRFLPDSAKYTAPDGTELRGSYSVKASQRNGLMITFTVTDALGMPTGQKLMFSIKDYENGSTDYELVSDSDNIVDYVRLDNGFIYTTLLVIYNESGEVNDSVKAQIWLQINGDYEIAAEGYVTSQTLKGGFATLYTFTRTELHGDVTGADKLFTKVVFMLDEYFDSTFLLHDAYYVYEYVYGNGESQKEYTVIKDLNDGSNAEIWYMDIGVAGMGTLYFADDGTVYSGSMTIDTTNYYFGNYGIFTFVNANGYVDYFYFDIGMGSNGPSTFEIVSEIERPLYGFEVTGGLQYDVKLIIRGNDALYSVTGSFEEGETERCTIEYIDMTDFAEDLYVLRYASGVEAFKFIMFAYDFYEQGFGTTTIDVYYIYYEQLATTFTNGTSTLYLDGLHNGTYTVDGVRTRGTFTVSADFKVVFFTATEGENIGETITMALAGKTFSLLDGIYGTYNFYIYGDLYRLIFDGLGGITSYIGNRYMGEGNYYVRNQQPLECVIFVVFDDGPESFTVSFGYDGLVILDEAMQGTFVDENWSVLYLDGYGFGTYYPADGSGIRSVYYDVINEDDGYISLIDGNFNYFNFILNTQNHTFKKPVLLSNDLTYYGSDFGVLKFTREGDVQIKHSIGYYSVLGNSVRVYLLEDMNTMYYTVYDYPTLPGAEIYEVNGKPYYLWHNGQSVTFEGTIKLGEQLNTTATLTFTPDGNDMFYARGVFELADGTTYNVTVVNQFWNYSKGRYEGLALYDSSIYEYSPFTSYVYNPTDKNTFTIESNDYVITVMYDGFEENEDSVLTEKYLGFGPIRLTGTTVSGNVVVGGGNRLQFTDAQVEAVLYGGADLGYRYMAVFTVNEVTYAIHYYKYDGDYRLYMITTYETLDDNASHYTVGIGYYYYSNGGFDFFKNYKVGDLAVVVLYETISENKSQIVAFNSLINGDGKTAWLIALDDYISTGEVSSIYTIEFEFTKENDETQADGNSKITSVTVKKYAFKQGLGGNSYYFANFCMDESGKIVAPVALAVYDSESGSYQFLIFTYYEGDEENGWTFHSTDGNDYVLKVKTDAQGNYETDSSGNLQIEITIK